MKHTRFSISERYKYKDGVFEAGLVRDSPHNVNKIYLRVGGMFFHLREDEVFAILNVLSKALWCERILRSFNAKNKVKWYSLAQITRDNIRKPKVIEIRETKEGVYLTMKPMDQ